ncbi:DUF5677 domain-containing protein [Methylorubrum extorquens]
MSGNDESDEDDAILRDFLSEMQGLVEQVNTEDVGFIDRCYERWKTGFDLITIFLHMSTEYGAEYNTRNRPSAAASSDLLFEALINIHAKSLRISNEIHALLREGFPDGALSRWRTLHELAVCAVFLKTHGNAVAEKFILHREVDACRKMTRYRSHQVALGLQAIDDHTLRAMEARRDAIVQIHGQVMLKDLGWAAGVFGRDRVTFADIEKSVGLEKWRPYYYWSCDDIHATFTPNRVGLGVSEAKEELLLVGRSNGGFTDPAQLMAISMDIVNNCLPEGGRIETDYMILECLGALVTYIQNSFWEVQNATTP